MLGKVGQWNAERILRRSHHRVVREWPLRDDIECARRCQRDDSHHYHRPPAPRWQSTIRKEQEQDPVQQQNESRERVADEEERSAELRLWSVELSRTLPQQALNGGHEA